MKNIAEILKDCPSGMELDCINYNGIVTFEGVNDCDYFPIEISVKYGNQSFSHSLTKYGQTCRTPYSKCVIFPKGKNTWEGFQRPFNDGDIIYVKSNNGCGAGLISIYKNESSRLFYDHCSVSLDVGTFYLGNVHGLIQKNEIGISRLATEEEKQKLFDAIKANGHKWNPETKTLEKLIEPKFKVGDRIKNKYIHKDDCAAEYTIIEVYAECYKTDCGTLPFENQDYYKLVPKKFDITTLKPFESRVLVRSTNDDIWRPAIYGFTDSDRYYVVGGIYWKQCVPYEVNKELIGTTNNPKEYGSE